MAHSPLLRTMMRSTLDNRSVSLTNYELELDDISTKVHNLSLSDDAFDATGWADSRKTYESKKSRESQRERAQKGFLRAINREVTSIKTEGKRSHHHKQMWNMYREIIPVNLARIKLALARTGFLEWKPRSPTECLRDEEHHFPDPPSRGRVSIGNQGLLDWRELHPGKTPGAVILTPQYVPKVHLHLARKRLEVESIEFAAFVRKQSAAKTRKPIRIPRPQDDSSDEGLKVPKKELFDILTQTPTATGEKRKRTTKAQPRRTRPIKAVPFSRCYDAPVHDRMHLNAQARNRLCLLQQRLPRVEIPLLYTPVAPLPAPDKQQEGDAIIDVDADFESSSSEAEEEAPAAGVDSCVDPMNLGEDPADDLVPVAELITGSAGEDPELLALRINGISLPVQLPAKAAKGETQEYPTLKEVKQYLKWRKGPAREHFAERDGYMQTRLYRQQVGAYEPVRRYSQALIKSRPLKKEKA